MLRSIRNFFQGPSGPPGAQGMKGDVGESTNVKCGSCGRYRNDVRKDYPRISPFQEFRQTGDCEVQYRCAVCLQTTDFIAFNGILFESTSIHRSTHE